MTGNAKIERKPEKYARIRLIKAYHCPTYRDICCCPKYLKREK